MQRRQWHPTPILLPGKSHRQRSLVKTMGSLRVGHDWATSLSLFTFMHWRRKWQPTPVFLPGESQDRGAWWAAIYAVAQSRTRLKRCSSSSSNISWIFASINFYFAFNYGKWAHLDLDWAPPLSSSTTLGKLLNLSVPHFPQLENGNNQVIKRSKWVNRY